MLTRRTVLLAKMETSGNYGVDSVPTPSANAILIKDVNIKINGETLERDFLKSSLSNMQFVRGERDVELTFKTELKGSGTRGTLPTWGWEGVLMRACGFKETITANTSIKWEPVSTGFESATLYVYKDGLFHKCTGCRGSVKILGEVGKYYELEFTMRGLYNAVVDATPTAQTFSTVVPPVALGVNSFTVGSTPYAPIIERVEIDMANTLAPRRNMNSASGIVEQVITGRNPVGSFDPEAVLEATHPFWANWSAATALPMTLTAGSASGNTITITAPKLQYREIEYADKDGTLTYNVPFSLAMNSGDDEIIITIT